MNTLSRSSCAVPPGPSAPGSLAERAQDREGGRCQMHHSSALGWGAGFSTLFGKQVPKAFPRCVCFLHIHSPPRTPASALSTPPVSLMLRACYMFNSDKVYLQSRNAAAEAQRACRSAGRILSAERMLLRTILNHSLIRKPHVYVFISISQNPLTCRHC